MGKQSWELLERRTLLAAAGDLDSTFNSTGVVAQQFDNATIHQLAIQSDSKIVIVGAMSSSLYAPADFFLARFNSDGSLDHSFGTSNTGTVRTDFGGNEVADDVAIDSLGRIVVAGAIRSGTATADFAVARYTSDGKLDSTFSGDGKLTIDFGDAEEALALVISPGSDKITVAGERDFARDTAPIARLNADGSFDNSFSGDGKDLLSFCFRITDLALDPSGKTVLAATFLAGGTTFEVLAAKLLNDGSPDTSFGTGGNAETGGGEQDSRAVAAVGSDVVFISTTYAFSGFTGPCYRISGNGTHVEPFGIPINASAAIGSILPLSDGRLILGASSSIMPPEDGSGDGKYAWFSVARFNAVPDGSNAAPTPDLTFARTGVTRDPAFYSANLAGAAIDPQGRIVAAGNFGDSTISGNVLIVRYLTTPPATPFATVSSRGTLSVTGSSRSDTILVARKGSRVIGSLNGSDISFAGNKVKRIVIDAGDGDDVVTLSRAAATILGGNGNDRITLSRTAATVFGGDGNDSIAGSGLADSIDAGAGDDTIQGLGSIDPLAGDTLTGGDGTDTVDYSYHPSALVFKIGGQTGAAVRVGNDALADFFEIIQATERFADRFDAEGSIPMAMTLRGMGGNDFFNVQGNQRVAEEGGGGNDRFERPGPNVTVEGGYGNDVIRLAGLPASLDGGGSALYGRDLDTVIEIVVDQIPTLDLTSTRIENATGSGTIVGNELNNTLSAMPGADGVILYGLGGNDTLIGSAVSDNLNGNDGDDLLQGGGGDDRLHGGNGNDTLVGNRGKDHLWADADDDLLLARGDRARDTVIGGDGMDQASVDNSSKLKDVWGEIETLLV